VKRANPPRATASGAAVTLTENQRQILLRMFAGCLANEIAAATGRKPSTISNTLQTIRTLIGARTDLDLMHECLRRQLVTLDEILALADARRGEANAQADALRHEQGAPPDDPERG
jgi:DNA-binding CsgD family transcriptional regulator